MPHTSSDISPTLLTRQIKTKLLMYFRFTRGFPYTATEAGTWNADVLASNGKEVVETEVKVSWTDFTRDAKKPKHQFYRLPPVPNESRRWSPPNRFFYAAPPELTARILEHLESQKSPYGLIEVRPGAPKLFDNGKFCEVRRQARKIHAAPPDARGINTILSRMSSELITLRQGMEAAQ